MSERLIVAGFHRSGTSLVCQLLHEGGLFLGYELLGANPSNPYGHYEDVEVLDLHKQILADNGRTWLVEKPFLPFIARDRRREMERIIQRRDAEHELWGIKDPRVCLFMMAWKHLLPDAKVLLVYRHYADSTYSLAQRHSAELFSNKGPLDLHRRFWKEPDLALRAWLAYNEALLTFARAYPEDTLAVSLDMVQDGFPMIEAIERRWGLGLKEVPVSEVYDPVVTDGRPGRQPVSDGRLIPRVEETWGALERLGGQTRRMIEEATVRKG